MRFNREAVVARLSHARAAGHRLLFTLAGLAAVAVCGQSLLAYLRFVRSRIFEPYAIWWLEPLFYRSALAFHMNQPLYGPPNMDYTPPIYNPGLAVVGGLLFDLFGPSMQVLRQFCFLMFVCLAVLVALWACLESRDLFWGVVSLCLTLAICIPMRHYTTAINTDAPCAFFCVLAVYLLCRHQGSRRATVASALSVVAAFMFKQPACLLGPALAFYLWTRDRRRALLFIAVCGSAAALLVAALLIASDGWYWTYAFVIPIDSIEKDDPRFFRAVMTRYHFAALAFWGGAPLLTLLSEGHRRKLWVPLWAAAFAMAYLSFRKDGGGDNVLFPVFWFGVLTISLSAPLLVAQASNHAQRWMVYATCLAIAVSSVHFQFDPVRSRARKLSKAEKERKGREPTYPKYFNFERRIRKQISSASGPVFVGARFLDLSQPLNTHQTPLKEGSCRTRLFDLEKVVEEGGLARHRYQKMLVWSFPECKAFDEAIGRYYRRGEKIGADPLFGTHVHTWTPKKPETDERKAASKPGRANRTGRAP